MFDLKGWNLAQIVEALTSPLNRHATRVSKQCTDEDLHLHPEWLMEQFIKSGGAKDWAKTHPRPKKEES